VKIVMFTNTYLPVVGGVARSVSTYSDEFRRRGHDVRIVAPQFEGAVESTEQVLRTPALKNFNGSDFSFTLPQPGLVADFLDRVQPELLHSHHPFQLGDTALRAAWTRRLPLVFTHHTLWEQYTHYVPLDSEALQRVVMQMATEYANLCTHVIAPSQSIAEMLVQRGVTTPISVIPTGIDLEFYGSGDWAAFRQRHQIPQEALVVGYVGRLANEKNLEYLAKSVAMFAARRTDARFLVVGAGDSAPAIQEAFTAIARAEQLVMPGALTGQDLADAYAALDIFTFSSQSETQGMVLAEAMAARTPVVALDGPGVRDVIRPENGHLLPADALESEFAAELERVAEDRFALRQHGQRARESIHDYSLEACATKMLELYEQLVRENPAREEDPAGPWDRFLRRLEVEWNLLVEKTAALTAAARETNAVAGNAG
jgi:glycosyltransferase involved in cell wall biosynthesis